jgi:hypothetical protein
MQQAENDAGNAQEINFVAGATPAMTLPTPPSVREQHCIELAIWSRWRPIGAPLIFFRLEKDRNQQEYAPVFVCTL